VGFAAQGPQHSLYHTFMMPSAQQLPLSFSTITVGSLVHFSTSWLSTCFGRGPVPASHGDNSELSLSSVPGALCLRSETVTELFDRQDGEANGNQVQKVLETHSLQGGTSTYTWIQWYLPSELTTATTTDTCPPPPEHSRGMSP
jgi:hypothetical protein